MPTLLVQSLESLAAGFFLWLGLFLLSRGLPLPPQRRQLAKLIYGPIAPAGASLVLASLYQFSGAMRTAVTKPSQYVHLFRLAWWAIPIAAGLWLRAVIVLLARPNASSDQVPAGSSHSIIIPTLIIGLMAAAVAIAGTSSQAIFAFQQIIPVETSFDAFYIPPASPGYPLVSGMLLLVLWGTTIALWSQRHLVVPCTSHGASCLLPLGNAIFAAGVTIRLVGYWLALSLILEQIGDWLTALGLAVLGHGVVRADAFLKGETVRYDYWRSLRGTGLAVLPSMLLTILLFHIANQPMSAVLLPLQVLLLVLLSTPLRAYTWLVNAWTLPAWQSRFMQRLADVRYLVLTAADQEEALSLVQEELVGIAQEARRGLQREIINSEVSRIFQHKNLQKDQLMGNSKLSELSLVQQATVVFAAKNHLSPDMLSEAERARILRKFLIDFTRQRLSPAPGEPPPAPASDQWLAYLILTKSYLEGKTRREVILEIQRETGARLSGLRETGGRAYASYLRQGRERLAELLWRSEMQP
jgi:hypothetical protein